MIVAIGALMIATGLFFIYRGWVKETPSGLLNSPKKIQISADDHELYKFNPEKCPAETRNLIMDDVYMRGIIEKGSDFVAAMNWYACHQPARGDVVLYRFSRKLPPAVKRVVAIPGDTISVKPDEQGNGWNLYVNNLRIESEGQAYFFGGKVPPPIKLYEMANAGVLAKDKVIVLSSFPPGDLDSSIFGVVSIEDIVAKIQMP